ncbi:pntA, partial [Symbiodinium sp. CCMP2456]
VVGSGAGAAWLAKGNSRQMCPNTGEGFDSIEQHLSICPAVGRVPLYAGDEVRLARLTAAQLNGKVGVLQHFARDRQRWVVRLDGRDALFKAANLDKV